MQAHTKPLPYPLFQICIALAILALGVLSCEKAVYEPTEKAPPAATVPNLRLLALGDSYTIGEGVNASDNFPNQLVRRANHLLGDSSKMLPAQIVAQTGWTAGQLLWEAERESLSGEYDLITLLIGANNQYQNRPFAEFEADYEDLLQLALRKTQGDSSRLVLISIPDYAYTPFGQNSGNPRRVSTEIDKYNAYIEQRSESLGLPFVNITDLSRKGLDQPELVAPDGLHPSAEMYKLWVQRLLPLLEQAVVK